MVCAGGFCHSEACHYCRNCYGPVAACAARSLTNIWWNPNNLTDVLNDLLVLNPNIDEIYCYEGEYVPHEGECVPPPQLWDYVIADGFVLETYLLDPNTNNRIMTTGGQTVPVLGPNPYLADDAVVYEEYPNFDPIFRYAAEDRNTSKQVFNTLYNLDHRFADPAVCGGKGAFECLSNGIYNFSNNQFNSTPGGTEFDAALSAMTASRQFYDLGSPLQARIPSSFDVTFWVINDSMVAGAPVEVYRFSQTVHLPAGYMRRRAN